jgi:DNA polymerase-3 subunit epsilon
MEPTEYEPTAAITRDVMLGKSSTLESTLAQRMKVLAEGQRFEQAALWRDRLEAALRARDAASELRVFAQIPQIVAAASRAGGWDIHVIRHGRLAAAGFCPTNGKPRAVVQTLIATAEHVPAPAPPDSAALVAETRMILRWLADARPVAVDGQWALPVRPSVRP